MTNLISSTHTLVQTLAVDIVWRQWSCLGAGGLSRQPHPTSQIDPEALVLLTLLMQDVEYRLADFVAWWAKTSASLLSVQRMKTLLKDFPPSVEAALGGFAQQAVQAGDKRWKPYALNAAERNIRPNKGNPVPRLHASAALLIRLRAGMGVHAKTDALAFLLGTTQGATTVHDMTEALGYSSVTVRNAVKDMALAGLVHVLPGHPARYYVKADAWATVLAYDVAPARWCYWASLFAFLAQSYQLFHAATLQSTNAYVLSSKARTLSHTFASVFAKLQISVPKADTYQGSAYLEAFYQLVEELQVWIEAHG